MARVALRGIFKKFGLVTAVNDLTLEIGDQEFVTLVGPSGCGKTTTLRMIAGLERPTAGEILFDGEAVEHLPANQRDVAMVFQSYALYPHMNVWENMAFPLRMMKVGRREIEARVKTAAAMLGIEMLLDRKPRELSGGQRQRVALGRAIVREPAVFLMDEPLSNLDAKLRVQTRAEIKRLHLELKKTFIYVTHDQAEAMTMSDRIAVMDHGRLQQHGTPREIYDRPRNQFVAGFMGSPPMNFLEGLLEANGGSLAFVWAGGKVPCLQRTSLASNVGQPTILGIRPECITVVLEGEGLKGLRAVVYIEEPMGSDLYLTLEAGGARFKARTGPDTQFGAGAAVQVRFDPAKLHFFDPATGAVLT
jgi:multiple sugar transport system ATP-binding protein